MKRVLCGLLMALASHTVVAEEIVTPAEPFTGWSWYNEPKKPPEQSRKPQQPAPQAIPDLSKMSPMEQARVLKGYTQEALNRAILYPSRENTATFLRWQKFWTDRASMFSQSFAAAQLSHPDLDYNLDYPHYNSMTSRRGRAPWSSWRNSTVCSTSTGAVTRLTCRWRAWWRTLRKPTGFRLSRYRLTVRWQPPCRRAVRIRGSPGR